MEDYEQEIYDYVISLGEFCMTAETLKLCGLRKASFPFDWSGGLLTEKCGVGGLEIKVKLLINKFQDWFDFADLEKRGVREDDARLYHVVNTKTGLQYNHDFPVDKTMEESFITVKEKYERRKNRILDILNGNNKILFVFIHMRSAFENDYVIQKQQELKKAYPNCKIDFLYILNNNDYNLKKCKKTILNDSCVKYECNVFILEDPKSTWLGNQKLVRRIIKDNTIKTNFIGKIKRFLNIKKNY